MNFNYGHMFDHVSYDTKTAIFPGGKKTMVVHIPNGYPVKFCLLILTMR